MSDKKIDVGEVEVRIQLPKGVNIAVRKENARMFINSNRVNPTLQIDTNEKEPSISVEVEIPENFLKVVDGYIYERKEFKMWMDKLFKNRSKKEERIAMEEKARENAEKIMEETPEPLRWILGDLLEANIERWINDDCMDDTIGQKSIVKYGFTINQLKWIKELKEECHE